MTFWDFIDHHIIFTLFVVVILSLLIGNLQVNFIRSRIVKAQIEAMAQMDANDAKKKEQGR